MAQREDPTELVETMDEAHGADATHGHALAQSRAPITSSNFLMHPDTHAAILDMALLNKLGAEWLLWESETFARVLPSVFGTPSVSRANIEKIEAMRTLHANEAFWERWEVFVWCSMALTNIPADFNIIQKPTPVQAAVAVYYSLLVRDDIGFSDEVKAGIQVVCEYDHLVLPPAPLDFVRHELSGYAIDASAIQKAWASYLISRKLPQEETLEAVQVRKMAEVGAATAELERRYQAQAPLLQHL